MPQILTFGAPDGNGLGGVSWFDGVSATEEA